MSQPTSSGSDNGCLVGARHFGKCRDCKRKPVKMTHDVVYNVNNTNPRDPTSRLFPSRFVYLPLLRDVLIL